MDQNMNQDMFNSTTSYNPVAHPTPGTTEAFENRSAGSRYTSAFAPMNLHGFMGPSPDPRPRTTEGVKVKLRTLGHWMLKVDDALALRKGEKSMFAYIKSFASNGTPLVNINFQQDVVATGPKMIIAAMENLDPGMAGASAGRLSWECLEVVRLGVPLGTLHDFREKYIVMRAEAAGQLRFVVRTL